MINLQLYNIIHELVIGPHGHTYHGWHTSSKYGGKPVLYNIKSQFYTFETGTDVEKKQKQKSRAKQKLIAQLKHIKLYAKPNIIVIVDKSKN